MRRFSAVLASLVLGAIPFAALASDGGYADGYLRSTDRAYDAGYRRDAAYYDHRDYRDRGVASPRIDAREAEQRARIRHALRSGELTRREAERLRHNQARIEQLEARFKSDGVLTREERAELRYELDRQDRLIARLTHNDRRW